MIRISLLHVILLLSVNLLLNAQNVTFFTHKWCRKSDKATLIFKKLKLQSSFARISFQILQKKDQRVTFQEENKLTLIFDAQKQKNTEVNQGNQHQEKKQSNQINSNTKINPNIKIDSIPYPSIYIDCQNYRGFYQNQLSFIELNYWIQIYCTQVQQLPMCPIISHEYQFQLSSFLWKQITKQNSKQQKFQFLIQNPQIKVCSQKKKITTLNTKQQAQIQQSFAQQLKQITFQNSKISFNQLKLTSSVPLFFHKFNHNIRNYMILHQKIAIVMIYNDANNYKIKQFEQVYKSIMTQKILMSQQMRKIRDQYKFAYQMSAQNKKKLTFISTCCNPSQPTKCSQKGSNRTSHKQKSKQKTIQSLLNFINLQNYFQRTKSRQLVFAFRFNKQTDAIQKYVYEDNSNNLGNQFLFWIDWIFKHLQAKSKNQYRLIKTKNVCIKDQIFHTYDPRNLTTIQQNFRLVKVFKDTQIQIVSVQSYSTPLHRFKLCVEQKQPIYLNQIESILNLPRFEQKQKDLSQQL